MKKTKKALAALAIIGMVATMAPMNAFAATGVTTARLSGADRIGTAVAVAEQFGSATTAILAPAADANLVDALAAAPLARKISPILLTENNTLNVATKAELIKLGVTNVYVVGAISQAVFDQVEAMTGVTATQLKGADRIETAALISSKLVNPAGSFVVGYNALADALSVASYAAANNYSILVANLDGSIPASEAPYKGAKVYTVGGPTLVADIAGATRLAGADRFATNKVVLDTLGYSYNKVYVANGTDAHLVDSLVASSLAALAGAPIVLTDTATGGDAAAVSVGAKLATNAVVVALGGSTVVSNATVTKVTSAVPAVLAVSSVSAINGKQIQVVFNKSVDKDTVITGTDDLVSANVKFSRTTAGVGGENATEALAKAKLSDDKMTLTITVAAATYLNGNYSVSMTGVKSSDQKMADFAQVITIKDETAPTVSSAQYKPSTGKFELTLSEPVTAASLVAGTLRINGVPVTADVVTDYTAKVTVTRPADVALGSTASVYFAGAQDFKGNNVTPYSGNVYVTNDTTALQVVSLKQISSNKFSFVFNKAVAGAQAVAEADVLDSILIVKGGTAVAGANISVARNTTDTDNKTFDVTIAPGASLYATGSSSQDILVTLATDSITDVTGNKNSLYSQSLTMTRDITGPVISSSKLAADSKAIELTLNEAIDPLATSIIPANIIIRKDGTALAAITATEVSVKPNSDNKVLVVKPMVTDVNADGTLMTATYTVRLEAGAIKDVDGNLNTGNTSPNVTVDGSVSLKAIGFASFGLNVFEVTFSEAVSAASALNPSNYSIDEVALNSSKADVYFKAATSEKTVVVKLAEGTVNVTNTGSLGVSGVQTSSGKTVVSNYGIVTLVDNISAKLVSATVIGTNVLKLTFDENIQTTLTAAQILTDIEVKSTAGKLDSTGAVTSVSISGKDVVLTIAGGTTPLSTVLNGSNLTVKTLDTGVAPADIDGKTDVIVDANGYKAQAGISVVPTKQ